MRILVAEDERRMAELLRQGLTEDGRVVTVARDMVVEDRETKNGQRGEPKVGQRFYEEKAPGVGMDRAEIVSDSERILQVRFNF